MQFSDLGIGAVCGVMLLVLLINLGILLPILRRGFKGSTNPLREIRSPWHKEQEEINELRSALHDLEIALDEENSIRDG